MTKTQHNSNKELVGQGIGNMFAAVLGGIPGAGATMRTVVNISILPIIATSSPIKVEIAVKASKATRALGISLVTRGKR
jgi:hypothetical protein